MKISELIVILQDDLEKYGDLNVVISTDWAINCSINKEDFIIYDKNIIIGSC